MPLPYFGRFMNDTAACVARAGVVLVLVHHAPVTDLLLEKLVEVKTHHLSLLADTKVQEGNELEGIQQDARNRERVRRNGTDLGKLVANLNAVAVHGTESIVWAHAIEVPHPRLRKDTGQEGTDHATNTVEFEDIHTFIDPDPLVEVVAKRADDTGKEADQRSDPDRNETSRRGDADQTGDST